MLFKSPLAAGISAALVVAVTPYAVLAQVDLVVHNARVYTADTTKLEAEAFAISDGRFVDVGSSEEVLQLHPDARRIDAKGMAVLPGFIDAHGHLMNLGKSMLEVDLVGAASIDEVIARLHAFEEGLPEEAWITGRGWDQNDWPGAEFPSRQDLDGAFPTRPVVLTRIDGHAIWANTAALEAAGLERIRDAADPEGGRIVRDAQGEPTGIFIDAAEDLVDEHVPPHTPEQLERALRLALGETARYGLTGVHDAGVTLEETQLYRRAIDEGWFNLRLYGMISGRGDAFDHFCKNGPIVDYGDRLTVRSVKFYMDGALGSRGAALLADYSDDPGNWGLLMSEPAAFTQDVVAAFECGFQTNTHAIGDLGNRLVLETYSHAARAVPDNAGRHRVEHAQVVALEDIPRFAPLGVIASMQPTHATSDMYWAEDRLGLERVRGAYAWRTFLQNGVHVAFGSDFPVERVDPLLGFHAAVTRQDAKGWPEGGWYPAERVTREEALRGFTTDAAYAAFQENEAGSISRGKHADFIILSDDIMSIDVQSILDARVLATYLGGKLIYEAD